MSVPETIIAIGGGSMRELHTLKIDRTIVRRTAKSRPNALFIPTASSDSEEYCTGFHQTYGKRLKCETDELLLLRDRPEPRIIKQKIREADIIYVGGGNTLKMMRLWRHLGVDKMLHAAWKKGTVLAGLSAGMLCWFNHGHSDSMYYYNSEDWDYVRVKGLGFIPALGCPHYDAEKRDKSFEAMIRKTGDVGIACDNNCAFEVVDDTFRVLQSSDGAGAYKVYRRGGEVITEEVARTKKLMPLEALLEHS